MNIFGGRFTLGDQGNVPSAYYYGESKDYHYKNFLTCVKGNVYKYKERW